MELGGKNPVEPGLVFDGVEKEGFPDKVEDVLSGRAGDELRSKTEDELPGGTGDWLGKKTVEVIVIVTGPAFEEFKDEEPEGVERGMLAGGVEEKTLTGGVDEESNIEEQGSE